MPEAQMSSGEASEVQKKLLQKKNIIISTAVLVKYYCQEPCLYSQVSQ